MLSILWKYCPFHYNNGMSEGMSHVLRRAIIRLLRPIIRLMIRHNVPLGTFVDLLRHVYVVVAREELTLPGRKLSDSRISVVTGIPRKDIKRYGQLPDLTDDDVARSHNRAARVLTGWIQDRRFHDPKNGKPMDLPMEGEPSFSLLVQSYSGGVPPRAVLDELLRIGAIRRLEDEKLRLVSYGYVPSGDELERIRIMSEEISDYLGSVEHNISHPPDQSFLQLAARCDNLPQEVLEELRNLGTEKGRALLQDYVQHLARYDRDQHDDVFGTGRHKVTLGVYYYEEELSDE